MDLIKTLLVYMTVLLTSSTALIPALTPMPTAFVTPTPVATVAPTFSPAPFVPTLAPTAVPALTTLYVGDRGENVRVMQTRLKELGYLSGTVDGVFGRETLRAVERFQQYNNLSVDGIAGRNTLNKLYYDRNVVFAPVDVTPPPTLKPPVSANIPVYYMTTAGVRLYTEVLTLAEGRTTVRANNARVPQGYVLTGASQVTVTVSSQGAANPGSVTFTYFLQATNPPVTAGVTVNYLDEGSALLHRETVTLGQGTSAVSANDRLVPPGYTLTSVRTVYVTVASNGTASPSAISFVYRKAPVTVMVPVNYQDTRGVTFYSDQITLAAGTHTVIANAGYVPDGYTLQGASTQTVAVDAFGNASPPAVTFVYKAPATASVPVRYQDEHGTVLYEEVQQLRQGVSTVSAVHALVPAGYTLKSEGSVTVAVDAGGAASPASVTFTYQAPTTPSPTVSPAASPVPTTEPTAVPTIEPTAVPTEVPTPQPTPEPTAEPTPEPTPEPTAEPTEAPTPEPTAVITLSPDDVVPFLPEYQQLRFREGSYPVYTGPGEHYYRVENATVAGGVSRLYGGIGDWILIGYGTSSGGYRIGYITRTALPEGITAGELQLGYEPRELATPTKMTDDPIVDPTFWGEQPAGSTVYVLAYLPDNDHWAYIEVPDFENGQPVRGFINKDRLK